MHLLATRPGSIADGSEAVDLGQSPGDIVVLTAADTELACLSAARAGFGEEFPRLRLANLLQLGHNLSVDTYVDDVVGRAKLVVVRLLGGAGYWRYGIEQVHAACRREGIALAVLPGDDKPDADLDDLSTLPAEARGRLWRYLTEGGIENARSFLAYAATLAGHDLPWAEPRPLLRAGLYWPDLRHPSFGEIERRWKQAEAAQPNTLPLPLREGGRGRGLAPLEPGQKAASDTGLDKPLPLPPPARGGGGSKEDVPHAEPAPVIGLVFYRALVQAGNLAPVDALVAALRERGLNPLPVFVSSLKDAVSAELITDAFARHPPAVILNATSFAVSSPGGPAQPTPFDAADCPVLQVVFAGGAEAVWRDGTRGLSAQDLAMNVALTEIDGRVLTRAVSFKSEARWDPLTECTVVAYRPVPDRIDFTADLAAAWAGLRRTPAAGRRVALVLANYPNRDGRLGNGVGLDTPAGTVEVLRALAASGYAVEDVPEDAAALMVRVTAGPTNALEDRAGRSGGVSYPLTDYRTFFAGLPEAVRTAVTARWGAAEADPFVEGGAFRLAVHRFGHVVIGVQPARGYNIDPQATYHDPALVPPHGYLAFYAWLRRGFGAQAIVHMGKHGNLEWLPGKALALSQDCFPEAAFGPVPHLYPFIVNDPGEGTQAKRRTAAVIIDHLTPPLTRAESYGPLKDLEALVDEYYEAAGMDPRRLAHLRDRILDLARSTGLDRDCGVAADADSDSALAQIDNHLCELKEMQIRDGLHIFGRSPEADQRTDLLVALTRVPRGTGQGGDASLIRALANDLGLGFDPLDCRFGDAWAGPRPAVLGPEKGWRTCGDTVERLEGIARDLVAGHRAPEPGWTATVAVLVEIEAAVAPSVDRSGAAEIDGLLRGLDGRFVPAGSSGAPTRGRLDVLPTGRNFYSVDSRTVPTPAAWHLGWKSASLLVERHRQEHGDWPRTMALSAWGTSNMRTGGDDIAQALALLGVQPRWDPASRRVTGFEVMPEGVLGRPRVDVTLRVSGFFRDAFPSQIDLFDSAVRAVAALDEPEEANPLAARVRAETAALVEGGVAEAEARRRAGFRVFGSKPGSYGAGLQALIDEKLWRDEADLGRAYLEWGGWAYGDGAEGAAAHDLFARRLERVEAVVHNQDNREHDLLDSDDYYQFEGGLAAAIHHLSGARPAVWHNDHSRPERPVIWTLREEIARVVRARVVNPKWIRGVMRHGYKGAFEMAATVDYLFAFAATTDAVADHQFDLVYDAMLGDPEVRAFLEQANPAAAREIAERLQEALDRGLWQPRANAVYHELDVLTKEPRP
ncbi:cobaltochelatase CobN [Inquilinus ginsengisoli]|uniref:cobaltochelatase subunit CobN n=1 Tax=Inquilinus ginsengisoli TaxID=363840 RepID=UPI003D24A8A5